MRHASGGNPSWCLTDSSGSGSVLPAANGEACVVNSARTLVALRRFGISALRLRALASLLLALERRRIAHPEGLGLRRSSKLDYSRDLRPVEWVSIKLRCKIPEGPCPFYILLGVLALVAVGAINLAKIPKPAVARHHEPIDPAILTTHLQKLQGEEALP
jgi:hypothetical protein